MKMLAAIILPLSLVFTSNALAVNVDLDKRLHFMASTAVGFASQTIFEGKDKGFYACATVGLAKELYDEVDYGGFDTNDMVMNLLGCAVGTIIGDEIGLNIGISKIQDVNLLSINYHF